MKDEAPNIAPDRAAYVFDVSAHDEERTRLKLLQDLHDPVTKRLLSEIGLAPGMTCAEIGVGEGSIVRHMSQTVGEGGKVAAIDINPRFLGDVPDNVEVRRADITSAATFDENTYDIIHGRLIIFHIPDARPVLANLKRALKPGGVLLLEEPNLCIQMAMADDAETNAALARVYQAWLAVYANMGLDPAIGLKLPGLFEDVGLGDVEYSTDAPITPGGSVFARMKAMALAHVRDAVLKTGIASASDVEVYMAASENPRVKTQYYALVSVRGRKEGD